MGKPRRLTAFLLCVAGACYGAFALPVGAQTATAQTERAKQIGGKFMCMCGCNQVLTQCNHVGCTVSTAMLKELDQHVMQGDSEAAITQAFVQEYGPTVLSSPPAKGFNRIAWIAPIVFPLVALGLLWDVVRRWKRKGAVATATGPRVSADLIARARRESDKDYES